MVKVMLVEDDRTMLNLLSILLNMEGYQVIPIFQTMGIPAVIEQVHRDTPELVLMDVNMDTINGLDLLSALREDTGLKNLRVLMSSGIDVSEKCIARGADGFILKPYMPDALIQEIKKLVGPANADQ